jgi:dihydroflavonol-4-reductase
MPSPCLLVTGATGFLGRHLLEAATAGGVPAVALVRDPEAWGAQPWQAQLSGVVGLVHGTPLDPEAWLHCIADRGVTTIIHAAGMVQHTRANPERMQELNVLGTEHVVHAAQLLGARLIFVSSSGTVGCSRDPSASPDEHAPYAEELVGKWPYYASKIEAERHARALATRIGVELSIVRPPVLLGPGDHRRRSTGYVQKLLDRKIPLVPPGGMHFTDVRDVAAALIELAQSARPRPIYHLPGTASSMASFLRLVAELAGLRAVRHALPHWAAVALGQVSAALERRPAWLPDPVLLEMSTCHWGLSSLYASELGYRPRPASDTLRDTISWLRANAQAPAHDSIVGPAALATP